MGRHRCKFHFASARGLIAAKRAHLPLVMRLSGLSVTRVATAILRRHSDGLRGIILDCCVSCPFVLVARGADESAEEPSSRINRTTSGARGLGDAISRRTREALSLAPIGLTSPGPIFTLVRQVAGTLHSVDGLANWDASSRLGY
jgi:hypothetical protein